jgi:hypothetical protein
VNTLVSIYLVKLREVSTTALPHLPRTVYMNYLDQCVNPGLRFEDYAKGLVNTAIRSTETNDGALTIGIFGHWGTGKTTLMRCIENEFRQRKAIDTSSYKTIWFSPWKYDTKDKIWNALIQTILAEIEKNENVDSTIRKDCRELAWVMRFYAYEIGRELVLGAIKKSVKDASGVELPNLKGVYQTDQISEMYRNLNRFEEDFRKLVKDYVGENGSLIIFIDDLDRCLPADALTALEALKLYLDRADCIFFIGLDRRTIEQAVREKYSALSITGRDYIEKMIQLNFFIPESTRHNIVDLLQGDMNALAHHIDENLWRLIAIATGQNIRRMKQFLLAWNLVKDLLPSRTENHHLQEMAILLLVQMYFPRFYDVLPAHGYTVMSNFENLLEKTGSQRESILVDRGLNAPTL